MWRQAAAGNSDAHCSVKTPVLPTAHMHGASLRIQGSSKNYQEDIKCICGVPHSSLQWCGRKVSWTDSKNICRSWRRPLLLNSAPKTISPEARPKPESTNSWVTFLTWTGPEKAPEIATLNKDALTGFQKLPKASSSVPSGWRVWAQLGADPKSGHEPALSQYS